MNALVLIDLQNDFIPGGGLPVPKGDEIIPIVEELLKLPFDIIVATQDWHPADHGSFASNHNKNPGEKITLEDIEQILWPDHCIQNTEGAEFCPGWDTKKIHKIFQKGTNKKIDSYSAFFDNARKKSTGLDEYLHKQGIKDIYMAGLATDYCVKFSAQDALDLGFRVHIIVDACRGINIDPDDSANALRDLQAKGAELTTSTDLIKHAIRGGGIRTHDLFVPNEAR